MLCAFCRNKQTKKYIWNYTSIFMQFKVFKLFYKIIQIGSKNFNHKKSFLRVVRRLTFHDIRYFRTVWKWQKYAVTLDSEIESFFFFRQDKSSIYHILQEKTWVYCPSNDSLLFLKRIIFLFLYFNFSCWIIAQN